jgi:hypothetical protein
VFSNFDLSGMRASGGKLSCKKAWQRTLPEKGAVKGETRLFLQAKKCPHCRLCIDKV